MTNRPAHNLFPPAFLVVHSTLAFGAGISLALFGFPPQPTLPIAVLCLGMLCLFSLRLPNTPTHLLVIIFFLLVGFSRGTYALSGPQASNHIANLIPEQTEISLIGVVNNAVTYGIEKTTLTIDCREIFIPPSANLLVSSHDSSLPIFQQTRGLVKLGMRGKPAHSFLPGDIILARAKIGPPQGFNNPGHFNLSRFLASQNIYTTGWLSSPQAITKLDDTRPSSLKLVKYGPERLRAHLINFLRLHLPERQSNLYRALITGDRSGLLPNIVETFRSLGVIHLLAISGLHMALLAGAVIATTFWLLQRSETILLHSDARKISACAAIIPLVLYCIVAGFQTPALRALIMILIFISALLTDRKWHGPTNISLAALLILSINPLALSTVSFQLSFAAVTGIVLALPHTSHLFKNKEQAGLKYKIMHYLTGGLAVSLAASLATLPLLLFHFNHFPLSGPLATIIIEPFLCLWALGWGLPASLLAAILPGTALLLFKIGGMGIDTALFLAQKLHPLARTIWLPTPSPIQVILYYSALFLILNTKKIWLRGAAILCCLMLFVVIPHDLKTDEATILDVGQGNCTLIKTSNNKVLVIDAGGPHSSSFDIGRQVIGPALWSKGIRAIDLLVLSHPDQDHYSGATFLLEHFAPKTVWIPSQDAKDPGWNKMLSLAKKGESVIHIPQAGERYPLGGNREFSCLTDLHLSSQEKQNNRSLVVKFISKNHSLLMPGDIEKEGEKYILDNEDTPPVDIIIAPHHGSTTSSSREFLDHLSPKTVIFSASRFKKSHFPNKSVQARYQKIGASSLLTPETGAITLFFQKEGIEIATRK